MTTIDLSKISFEKCENYDSPSAGVANVYGISLNADLFPGLYEGKYDVEFDLARALVYVTEKGTNKRTVFNLELKVTPQSVKLPKKTLKSAAENGEFKAVAEFLSTEVYTMKKLKKAFQRATEKGHKKVATLIDDHMVDMFYTDLDAFSFYYSEFKDSKTLTKKQAERKLLVCIDNFLNLPDLPESEKTCGKVSATVLSWFEYDSEHENFFEHLFADEDDPEERLVSKVMSP